MEIRDKIIIIGTKYHNWEMNYSNNKDIREFTIEDDVGYLFYIDVRDEVKFLDNSIYVCDNYLRERSDNITNKNEDLDFSKEIGYILKIGQSLDEYYYVVTSKVWHELYRDNFNMISYEDFIIKGILE